MFRSRLFNLDNLSRCRVVLPSSLLLSAIVHRYFQRLIRFCFPSSIVLCKILQKKRRLKSLVESVIALDIKRAQNGTSFYVHWRGRETAFKMRVEKVFSCFGLTRNRVRCEGSRKGVKFTILISLKRGMRTRNTRERNIFAVAPRVRWSDDEPTYLKVHKNIFTVAIINDEEFHEISRE